MSLTTRESTDRPEETPSGDPTAYPDAGEPWQPLKIYYNHGFTRGRIMAFHEALVARQMESPYVDWIKAWEKRPERTITTRVECGAWCRALGHCCGRWHTVWREGFGCCRWGLRLWCLGVGRMGGTAAVILR